MRVIMVATLTAGMAATVATAELLALTLLNLSMSRLSPRLSVMAIT